MMMPQINYICTKVGLHQYTREKKDLGSEIWEEAELSMATVVRFERKWIMLRG